MQLPIIKVIFCLVGVKLLTLCYAAGKMNVDNADCYNKSCADCQCIVGETFVQTRGQYGKCVSNELVVYVRCK